MPKYPEIHVQLHSRNPFALVSAVRLALRKSEVGDEEIRRFSDQAMSASEPRRMVDICGEWAEIEVGREARGVNRWPLLDFRA